MNLWPSIYVKASTQSIRFPRATESIRYGRVELDAAFIRGSPMHSCNCSQNSVRYMANALAGPACHYGNKPTADQLSINTFRSARGEKIILIRGTKPNECLSFPLVPCHSMQDGSGLALDLSQDTHYRLYKNLRRLRRFGWGRVFIHLKTK